MTSDFPRKYVCNVGCDIFRPEVERQEIVKVINELQIPCNDGLIEPRDKAN